MNVPLPRPAVDVEHDRLSGLIRRLEPPAEQSAGAVGDAPLLLTPAEAAEVLRVDLSELRTMRTIGIGPDYHDVGRGLIRYARDSVLALVGDPRRERASAAALPVIPPPGRVGMARSAELENVT